MVRLQLESRPVAVESLVESAVFSKCIAHVHLRKITRKRDIDRKKGRKEERKKMRKKRSRRGANEKEKRCIVMEHIDADKEVRKRKQISADKIVKEVREKLISLDINMAKEK